MIKEEEEIEEKEEEGEENGEEEKDGEYCNDKDINNNLIFVRKYGEEFFNWELCNNLNIEDEIFSISGEPCKIINIFSYDIDHVIYSKIFFSDSTSLILSDAQEFLIYNEKKEKEELLDINKFLLLSEEGENGFLNYPLVMRGLNNFGDFKLPLDPYLVGFQIARNSLNDWFGFRWDINDNRGSYYYPSSQKCTYVCSIDFDKDIIFEDIEKLKEGISFKSLYKKYIDKDGISIFTRLYDSFFTPYWYVSKFFCLYTFLFDNLIINWLPSSYIFASIKQKKRFVSGFFAGILGKKNYKKRFEYTILIRISIASKILVILRSLGYFCIFLRGSNKYYSLYGFHFDELGARFNINELARKYLSESENYYNGYCILKIIPKKEYFDLVNDQNSTIKRRLNAFLFLRGTIPIDSRFLEKKYIIKVERIFKGILVNHIEIDTKDSLYYLGLAYFPVHNSGHNKFSKIKADKEKNDANRARITSRILNEISIALSLGGDNPQNNLRLKYALKKAKENSIPNDKVSKILISNKSMIKQSKEEIFVESFWDDIFIIIYALVETSSKAKFMADIKYLCKKNDFKLVDKKNAILCNFILCTQIYIDNLEDSILDINLPIINIDNSEGNYILYIKMESKGEHMDILKKIEQLNIKIKEANIIYIPNNFINISKEKMNKLIDKLDNILDIEQICAIYTNTTYIIKN